MYNFNFDFYINDLSGKPIPDAAAHTIVANSLINPEFREGDAIKKYVLATTLYQNKALEVDESDKELLIKSVKLLPPVFQAQILIYINSIKK